MFVDNALNKNALGFQEEFQTKIAEKISDALETKKADVARQMFDEEFITELKKKTLASYVKKAAGDSQYHTARAVGIESGIESGSSRHHIRKVEKRQAGIEKASDKLAKEEIDEKKNLIEDKWLQHAVHPSRAGMFDGVSVDTIRHELESLKKTGPHAEGSPQHTKMAQLEFALRAKTKHGFQNEATEREKKVVEKDKKEADKDAKKLTTEGMRQTWRGKRLTKSAMKTTSRQGTDPYNSHDAFSKNYKKLYALRGYKKK